MNKVTVYKLSNGELFKDREQAKRQKEINFNVAIGNLINNYATDESEVISDFINKNIPQLAKIFEDFTY